MSEFFRTAGIGIDELSNRLDRGGLPGAIWAQETKYFGPPNVEAETLEDLDRRLEEPRVKSLSEILHAELDFCHLGSSNGLARGPQTV